MATTQRSSTPPMDPNCAAVAHQKIARHKINTLFFFRVSAQKRIGQSALTPLQRCLELLLLAAEPIQDGPCDIMSTPLSSRSMHRFPIKRTAKQRELANGPHSTSTDSEIPIEKLRILSAPEDHVFGLSTMHEDVLQFAANDLQAYEDVTGASDFIGPGQQEMLHDLGIAPCVPHVASKSLLSSDRLPTPGDVLVGEQSVPNNEFVHLLLFLACLPSQHWTPSSCPHHLWHQDAANEKAEQLLASALNCGRPNMKFLSL
uniref:Uncharacterized protein n=1 Tax=Globodera pallida TaxID=36090 RepID=A0A183CK77_GLOPA